jgi:ABC-type molybdate transport system substrate-binding protein
VKPYAVGRIVLWSIARDARKLTLADPAIRKIAIANSRHAPYGKRAAGNPLAQGFADYMDSPAARRIMVRWGFALPREPGRSRRGAMSR